MFTLRSRIVLYVPTIILSVAFATVVVAQQPSQVEQQRLADETRPSLVPAARILSMKALEQHAAYWTSEPGWDTALQLKDNLASAPLTVTPILRLASGQEIPLTPVTISANASVSISVNQELREHAPDLLSQPGSYGSVLFRFSSFSAMNLHATAIPSMQGESVAFPIQARPAWDPTDNRPGSLEGIWWRPRSDLNDILVIGNSSDKMVEAKLSLFDASGKNWSEPLSFGPHQTERMAVGDLLKKAGLSGSYGGISLEFAGAASALQGVHLMYDEAAQFSASLDMFSRDPTSTVLQRTGLDQNQWTMRAPMLALAHPDPALGLSPKTKLQPTVFVRNTTARTLSAEVALTWRSDSSKGQVKLPELQLAPFATQQLQIYAMQRQLGIPENAYWALVSLTTSASPDDLIAFASSRDCSNVYNVETKFTGAQGGHFAGGEWRTDSTHNQIAAITNVGRQATDALLTLHFANGEKKYELQQTIEPGDQMWVNLSQLIRGGVSDRSGKVLPADVNAVTYEVQDLTPNGHNLMANDLAVNSASARVVPDCPTCCGFSSAYWSLDPIELLIDGVEDPSIDGVNACSGQVVDISADFTVWNSDNSEIAQVTTKRVQGVGAGSTTGYAKGTVEQYSDICGCTFVPREPTAPVTVQTPTSLSIVSGTDSTTTEAGCTTTSGYAGCGVRRTFKYQVNDQNGNPIRVANMEYGDVVCTTSTNQLNLTGYLTTCGGTTGSCSGTAGPCGQYTDENGQFSEVLTLCAPACKPSGTCTTAGQTTANQTWTVNGTKLTSDVKSISYQCNKILVNGK
jgi:hypothetical protein